MKILVATGNPHKLHEIRAILADPSIELLGLDDLPGPPLPTPVESGDTFTANAASKALHYARATGMATLADDSGLVVDALDGAPGVHSSRWMGEDTSYELKNRKLLELLAGVEGAARGARFVCVAALAWPDGRVITAEGAHEGRVHHEIVGSGGFGYDPVFFSLEAGQTFGTLSAEKKNSSSHRARAMQALRSLILDRARPDGDAQSSRRIP